MFNQKFFKRGTAAVFALILFMPLQCFGQNAKDSVAAEIKRVEEILSSLKIPQENIKAYLDVCKLAEDALQTDAKYLGLYRLYLIRDQVISFKYAETKAEIGKQGLEAFETEWRRLGDEIAEKKKQIDYKRLERMPAAVRAMVDVSLSRVGPYHQSGRLYGINTTIDNGVQYLGLAPANLDFAFFCDELNISAKGPSLKYRSIERELSEMDAEIAKVFSSPEADSQQRRLIVANSSLKLARDLNGEKRYAGALLEYLEACRDFGTVKEMIPDTQKIDSMKTQIGKIRTRLSSSRSDHSIGLLYAEIAQSALEQRVETVADRDTLLKRAAAIVDYVFPHYFKIVSGGVK